MIVGRKVEILRLQEIVDSKQAEFIAVYGRRRVGKTFLLRNYLEKKGVFLELTGVKDGRLAEQLENFTNVFAQVFYDNASLRRPQDWADAFELLTKEFAKIAKNRKIILFFDELPWLAARRSKFMQNLDYYWNRYWSKDSRIKLITCGSAASWMLDNLINSKGGLYNRVTQTILLKPFNLHETNEYLLSRNIKLTKRQILELYMVFGGVPYYLNQIKRNYSVAQNINNICFNQDGILFTEFDRLFKSLFEMHEQNRNIVLEVSKQHGISRDELLARLNVSSGGRFNERIDELESSGFIQTFVPYGKNRKEHYYRVSDEYTLFYLRWIEPLKQQAMLTVGTNYWQTIINTPTWYAWCGYAFESVCYKHVPQLLHALGLDMVACKIGSWRLSSKAKSPFKGTQIDLIIDRDDDVIMLGEIKFTKEKYAIDKEYALNLKHKIEAFTQNFKTSKNIHLFIIASNGLKPNIWSEDLVNAVVDAEMII